jgi:hypothetical protein
MSPPPGHLELASATPPPRGGFHLIPHAMADTLPDRHGGPETGNWAIQVGAFGNEGQARAAADAARGHAMLSAAHTSVGKVKEAKATLYRARLTGLSRENALQACEKISHGRAGCIVLSPDAQS